MTPRRVPCLTLLVAALVAGCGEGSSSATPLAHVDRYNFHSVVLESDKPVLLEFSSPSCGPCTAMEPHLAAFARKHAERIVCAKVIVEESEAIAREYDISAVPTLLVIEKGRVQDRHEGYLEESQLAAFIRPYLSGE